MEHEIILAAKLAKELLESHKLTDEQLKLNAQRKEEEVTTRAIVIAQELARLSSDNDVAMIARATKGIKICERKYVSGHRTLYILDLNRVSVRIHQKYCEWDPKEVSADELIKTSWKNDWGSNEGELHTIKDFLIDFSRDDFTRKKLESIIMQRANDFTRKVLLKKGLFWQAFKTFL